MKNQLLRLGAAVMIALCASVASTAGQAKPDNTAVNKRDKAAGAVTADSQRNSTGDLEMTRAIRRAIVADKSLSTYAHNIKVVTMNGKVTLKGPVRSDTEKMTVEAKAAEVAGAGNVINNISIVSAKPRAKKHA